MVNHRITLRVITLPVLLEQLHVIMLTIHPIGVPWYNQAAMIL